MLKQKNRLQRAVIITYAVVLMLILIFVVYMYFGEHNSIYQARSIEAYETVENAAEEVVEDEDAPAGIRKEYRWTLSDITTTKDYLVFYIVHHYAQVRIDGELVYSLTQSEDNRICRSPSSIWVFVPLDQSDNGRDIQVTLTPAFKSAASRKTQFLLGDRAEIMLEVLKDNGLIMLLSVLCIVMGNMLMIAFPVLLSHKESTSWGMFYLGNFLLLLGIWRITDTRFSPILFSENPLTLGYISILTLFLICVPLLLFMKDHFIGYKRTVLLFTALADGFVAFVALIYQIFQIAELRETIIFCHIMLIVSTTVVLLVTLVFGGRRQEEASQRWMILMLTPAVLMDLGFYYWKNTSSGAICTMVMFLIFATVRFFAEILSINRKIYVDAQTGLLNRSRWNDLTEKNEPLDTALGVMMLDLNRLKYINDTMGHKMGDKMILDFAKILRDRLPAECMIFRWGGDEFTVLVSDADHEKMRGYIARISEEVDWHNASGEIPEIHFAVGYALSVDYPTHSCEELMKKADEKMYHNKSEWYQKNIPGYHL